MMDINLPDAQHREYLCQNYGEIGRAGLTWPLKTISSEVDNGERNLNQDGYWATS